MIVLPIKWLMVDVKMVLISIQLPLKTFRTVWRNAQRIFHLFPFIYWSCHTMRIEFILFACSRFYSALAQFHRRLIFNVNKIKIIKTDSLFCHRAAVTLCPTTLCLYLWRPKSSHRKKKYRFRHAVAPRLSHEWWIQLHRDRIHWMSYIIWTKPLFAHRLDSGWQNVYSVRPTLYSK